MGLHLDALEIAAIGTASLAVLVLVSTLIVRFIHHRRSASPKPALSPGPSSLVTKLFFSSPLTAKSSTFKSASTPVSASTDATLVTPTQGGRLKKIRTPTPGGGQSPDSAHPHSQPQPQLQPRGLPAGAMPESVRDSEEIVMVTYEDGLARMGLRPHHILYADPPPFDQLSPRPSPPTGGQDASPGGSVSVPVRVTMSQADGWRTPGATPSTPGGAGIGTYRPGGGLGLGSSTRELVSSSRRSNAGHSEDLAGSPRASPGRRQRRDRDRDRDKERRRESGNDARQAVQVPQAGAGAGAVGSVWLPSYYQTTLARGVELPERDRPWDRPGGSGRI